LCQKLFIIQLFFSLVHKFSIKILESFYIYISAFNTKISSCATHFITKTNFQTFSSIFSSLLCHHFTDLGAPYFPGGPELWHHPLAYSAAAELPGSAAALQHATLVHPALHPQMPVRSYL
jgi:hypothetical protein